MSYTTFNNKKKSPNLHAAVVQSILESCINKDGFEGIYNRVQKSINFPEFSIKKYLFYLIEFDFISYSGRRKSFLILQDGLKLMHAINIKKKKNFGIINDLVITIE